jgi:phosphoribosyl 1,2-cyclic phosphate phosphodiesterase
VLIDAGPDFRAQALRHQIRRIDAVLITHHHFDHVAGLDDLRPYLHYNKKAIPCYANAHTADVLRRKYDYIFARRRYPGVPNLQLLEVDGPFDVSSRYGEDSSVRVNPVDVRHGHLAILGFQIGGFAYLTDASYLPDDTVMRLSGIETLVLSALREEPHPTHFSIEESVEAASRVGARRTIFIHMTHSVLHARDQERLPDGCEFGYDGLSLDTEL